MMSILSENDRCDRCGARAYVLVILDRGSELTFCGHHGRKYRRQLTAAALVVHDETQLLTDSTVAPSS